jgi:hypothetical protein
MRADGVGNVARCKVRVMLFSHSRVGASSNRCSSWPLLLLPANGRQCLLAQYIGIAFACLGNLNDLDGDGLSDTIVTVASPQSNAGHFEGDAKNPRSSLGRTAHH